MTKWTQILEEELTLLIKDWLKHNGKTQVDLRDQLKSNSSRMPTLIESLRKEYSLGGMQKVAQKLCEIENDWSLQTHKNKEILSGEKETSDPFNQLDLLLEELREDSDT